jgi:hypothetical protein
MKDILLSAITTYYLHSGEFNGMSVAGLIGEHGMEWGQFQGMLASLIEEDLIGIVYPQDDPNSHILRVGFAPKENQIARLAAVDESHHTCIYPRPKHLNAVVDTAQYAGEPYKLYLALGEPQLAYRSFDLSVLEYYRNDPRYIYQNNDIDGYISIIDNPGRMAKHDQVLLESFGFSYDQDFNRAVAVFLRYLVRLSPEHQRIWQVKELAGDYALHSDYYDQSVFGNWGKGISVFTAFLAELHLINQMAAAMGRGRLFREDFGGEGNRSPKFTFLVRPTLEEFNDFVHLLDKLLSDNIDKAFFKGEVPDEEEHERKDGKIEVRQRGTLQILDDWVRKKYRLLDWKPWDDTIAALRKVRRLRQKPAHAVNENVFDQKYFKEQRELIIEAQNAVNIIRQLLAKHPMVKKAVIEIPDWLNGTIWTR